MAEWASIHPHWGGRAARDKQQLEPGADTRDRRSGGTARCLRQQPVDRWEGSQYRYGVTLTMTQGNDAALSLTLRGWLTPAAPLATVRPQPQGERTIHAVHSSTTERRLTKAFLQPLCTSADVPLVECMYMAFTCRTGESCRRRLGSLSLFV